MRHSRRQRHTECFSAWSFITHRSTRAGSTWWKSKSACCVVNVWIVESASASPSSPRSTHGSGNATSLPRRSNGSSQRKRRARSWHAPIRTPPKSHNHCAEVLAVFAGGFTIEAATSVMQDSGLDQAALVDGVSNLVAKSLVSLCTPATDRWRLLETIRTYALEKLVEHGEADTAARH